MARVTVHHENKCVKLIKYSEICRPSRTQ